MERTIYDVLIIGAGCAGLSAASKLKDLNILILEKENHIGGRVHSVNINGFIGETGALFPISSANSSTIWPRNDSSTADSSNLHICYSSKEGQRFYGNSTRNVLEQISPSNNSSLISFFEFKKTLNPYLKYEVLNDKYGDLIGLDQLQTQALESFFQITISGSIKDCIRSLRPQIVSNIARPDISISNSSRLTSLYQDLVPLVRLNTNVISIESGESLCKVTIDHCGQEHILSSKYVLSSAPPPQSLPLIHDARTESLQFYNSMPYCSGTVCILCVEGVMPSYELLVASSEAWSSAFFSRLTTTSYIVHIYYPARNGYQRCSDTLTIDRVFSDLYAYLPRPSHLTGGNLRYWNHVSPLLHSDSFAKYTPEHFKVKNRVWLCGELAGFSPVRPFSYGTQAAMSTGARIAQQLICDLSSSAISTYEGLFNSDLFKLDDDRPMYVRSRRDGNIAFYGIILSAYKSDLLRDYLKDHMIDGQWEFHIGYGTTLEDSLLVLEGLLDTDNSFREQAVANMAKYHRSLYDYDTNLFVTHKNVATKYWRGPSIFGNAQILYLSNKLNESPTELIHWRVVDFLARSQQPNLLWKSKWFANDFFTTYYVTRAIFSCSSEHSSRFHLLALAEYLVQVLSNNMKSSNEIVTSVYALRTLLLLLRYKSEYLDVRPLASRIRRLASHYNNSLILADQPNQGAFLYYWQDVGQHTNSRKERTMTVSKPESGLLNAMITLAKNDCQSSL